MKFRIRLSAFIIDIMFITAVFMLLYYFIPVSDKVLDLQANLNNINEAFIKKEILFSDFFKEYTNIIYNLDKEQFISMIINALTILFYFVLVPYFTNGITLGSYILGFKIKEKDKEKVSLKALFIRSLIINGGLYLIVSIIFLFTTSNELYFALLSILGIFQIGLVITSIFMVLYRHDLQGLQDYLSGTKLIKR